MPSKLHISTEFVFSLQNRLDVYFESVIVSLERAYNLFIRKSTDSADCGKMTKEEYAVYSHFMRNGYTIQEYTPETKGMNRASEKPDPSSQTQQCIWSYLFELLGQQQHATKRSNVERTSETYERVKTSMDNIISEFRSPNAKQESVPQKRKWEDSESTSEERHTENQYFGTESLNAFMIGDERKNFRKVFDQIDVIQLNSGELTETDPSEMLHFSFDLWTDVIYKKSDCLEPNYRIVVLRYVSGYFS